MIKTKNIDNIFIVFLIFHLILWTLIPALTNQNLPLDTIEALAWGSNLDWGFSKHPPLSALFVEFFYQIFGNNDWAYYLLSQLFVIFSFFIIWNFSKEFLESKHLSIIALMLLEGVFFYNFTTPEFNVNICQLPFWALTIHYSWKCYQNDKILDWILLGIFLAAGFLSKYLFIYLIIGVKLFFCYLVLNQKKFKFNYLIPTLIFLILLTPHLFWLKENNFETILYGLNRSSLENFNFLNHFINPIILISKQIILLIPLIVMFSLIILKIKVKINMKNKKFIFLTCVTLIPIILIILTSLVTGAKIRTMWMTPFYLFLSVYLVYIYQNKINFKNFKKFAVVFLFFFFLSPIAYLSISMYQKDKRTDYPGKEVARLVQNKWDQNFYNEIKVVVGDEWFAGNLSYHLSSRPIWFNTLEKGLSNVNSKSGVIYVGNPKILKKLCPGTYGTIRPIGICMIGAK
jgi:4-amino-4-deoxy-L-arabinose transferase-like glycosyltransferase